MTERFGNQGRELTRDELNAKIGVLNDKVAEVEMEISRLMLDLEGGLITLEEYNRRYDPLEQQLSIANYNRDAYLARL